MRPNLLTRPAGVIPRDVVRLQEFLASGELHCTRPKTKMLTLAFTLCSIAHAEGISRHLLKQLMVVMIDGFNPDSDYRRDR